MLFLYRYTTVIYGYRQKEVKFIMQLFQWGPAGCLGNFTYLLLGEQEAYIIDPIDDSDFWQTIDKIAEKDLALFLTNTHSHRDHIEYNEKFLRHFPQATYLDHHNFLNGTLLSSTDNMSLQVWNLPGHTYDHVGFFVQGECNIAILGDTLFHGGVGNCRSGNVGQLYQTIQFLKKHLSNNTKLYFAHNYLEINLNFIQEYSLANISEVHKNIQQHYWVSTWADELKYNPFLQDISRERFAELRALRDQF